VTSRVLREIAAEQLRDGRSNVAMAKARRTERKEAERLHQGEDAAIADAERRGALGVDDGRLCECIQVVVADQAVVAQVFDAQEAPVGGKADLPQRGQIAKSPTDLEVIRVVDGRFGDFFEDSDDDFDFESFDLSDLLDFDSFDFSDFVSCATVGAAPFDFSCDS
jgi:hypothetical protein